MVILDGIARPAIGEILTKATVTEAALLKASRADLMFDCLSSISNICDVGAKAIEEQDDKLLGYVIMRIIDRLEHLINAKEGK